MGEVSVDHPPDSPLHAAPGNLLATAPNALADMFLLDATDSSAF